MEEGDIENEEAKQAYQRASIFTKDIFSKKFDKLKVQQPRWQITECIKNYQTKNHFAYDQRHAKNIKRSTENNLSRNGCTLTSNDIYT